MWFVIYLIRIVKLYDIVKKSNKMAFVMTCITVAKDSNNSIEIVNDLSLYFIGTKLSIYIPNIHPPVYMLIGLIIKKKFIITNKICISCF